MSNESSPVFSFAREEFQNLHVKMTKTCKVPVLNCTELFHEDKIQYDRKIFSLESDKIPEDELSLISKEVQQAKKVQELAGELEMSGHCQEDESSAMSLLLQWQERTVSVEMSPRPVLMYHLAKIGLKDLHSRLVSIAVIYVKGIRLVSHLSSGCGPFTIIMQ